MTVVGDGSPFPAPSPTVLAAGTNHKEPNGQEDS